MAKVGVILSGCGFLDGSEIHEATLTLYFLDRKEMKVSCFAPDKQQHDVVNYLTKIPLNESRNTLLESARIARGNIADIKSINIDNFDAFIFPGGYGVAKNLSDFAVSGKNFNVNSDLEKIIIKAHKNKIPIGFICIAPVIAAQVLGKFNPSLTIGNDDSTAKTINSLGGKHFDCSVDDIVVDEANKLVSTPAYMLGPTISRIAVGIEKLVEKVLELI